MALVGIELETLVSESDALTTRPPPCKSTQVNNQRLCHSPILVYKPR